MGIYLCKPILLNVFKFIFNVYNCVEMVESHEGGWTVAWGHGLRSLGVGEVPSTNGCFWKWTENSVRKWKEPLDIALMTIRNFYKN